MTDQNKILEQYPDAVAEKECCECYCIWDGESELVSSRDCMIMHKRSLLGIGKTEEEAWTNAVAHTKVLTSSR